MKDTLERIDHYLKAVSKKGRLLLSSSPVHEEFFPQLAVVFTKALPETSQFDMHHIFIDIGVYLYKPVNMRILLTASTTSNMASETTFFGANVLSSVPRHGPRYCERMLKLRMAKNAYIRQATTPILFPSDSTAVHERHPDFHLSMHPARAVGDGEAPARPQAHSKETFDAFFAAIPARKQGSDLCQLRIDCTQEEIDILCGAVSATEY
jgi:hypothetical protein